MIDINLQQSKILIVDDQMANIDVLETFLLIEGYSNIRTTKDPREALPIFREFNPDLILLDLMMPYLNGFEVMDQLQSCLQPNTYLPILVLTADATKEAKQRALSSGASDFLTKPFDLIEVGLRIKNLLYARFLQQQLHDQNLILEDKVRNRTYELEMNNVDLKRAKEKAEASDKLKSSFLNNISHEIRTPLNGILGFGNLLADPETLPEEKGTYLKIMDQSSARLLQTVSNIVDMSLISSGNLEVKKSDFWLKVIVNEVIGKYKPLCEVKNLSFSIEMEDVELDAVINADKDLLFKILFHLIDNAIKFTQKGSVIVGFKISENELQCSVKDSGIGISQEGQIIVFKDFMQEDGSNTRAFEGTGLGLSIAKGVLSLLGGKIYLESEKGKGAIFYFSIPVTVNSSLKH
jgi:signal transduction histidine kinase